MRKFLLVTLLFVPLMLTSKNTREVSPETLKILYPVINSLYQKLRSDTLPLLDTSPYDACKKFFNMKNENLDLPPEHIQNKEDLIALFMKSLFDMNEVGRHADNIPNVCRPLFHKMFERAMRFDFNT